MNTLPQILREPIAHTTHHRQGLFYNLKLDNIYKIPAIDSNRSSSKIQNRLKVNRYSIQKCDIQNRRAINYSTISYDYRNDPQFYGTKGKIDQIENYQVLLQQKQKQADSLALKVAAFRGIKDLFQEQFNKIKEDFNQQITSFETQFKSQIVNLWQTISDLRRQTQYELKSFKHQIKNENQQLIIFCDQLKKIDAKLKNFKQLLESL